MCSAPPPSSGLLTYNWTNVNSTINAMSPNGGTNQTIGLQWGWLSLLQQDPLNAPSESSTSVYQHIIILFTDGLNTAAAGTAIFRAGVLRSIRG